MSRILYLVRKMRLDALVELEHEHNRHMGVFAHSASATDQMITPADETRTKSDNELGLVCNVERDVTMKHE